MRFKSLSKNTQTPYVGILLLLTVGLWLCEDIGLFEGINNYGYHLAFRLRGERNYTDRIVIAAIDEKTLAELGKWPIRRSHYAELLNYLSQSAAVGMNIIFSEPSEDDVQLANAINRQSSVVLPAYFDRRFEISTPVQSLSPAAIGHVHLEQGIDGFVREVFHILSYQSVAFHSFSAVLYDVAQGKPFSPLEIVKPIAQSNTLDRIMQSQNMWINFYGAPGTFRYFSVADILADHWPPAFFTDKIVLVGLTTAGLHEGILVPFTDDRNRMPAVEVHAHILNNLLAGEFIRPLDSWVRWILVGGLTVISFFMFIRVGSIGGMLLGILILSAITLATFGAFATFYYWLSPAALYLSVAISFLLAYLFKLQNMKKLLLEAKVNWEESFNTIRDAICIYDANGNIIQANKAAEQIFGPPLMDFLRRRCSQLYRKIDAFDAGSPSVRPEPGITEEIFHPESNRHLEIKSLPQFDEKARLKGMVQIAKDITEHKNSQKEHQRLQEQLIQAQKMEAVGTLAGGIAHDFNNILAAVMGYTELTLLSVPAKSLLADQLNHVLKASLRAKDLVEQILTISRRTTQDIKPQPVEVGVIVKEALKLIQSTFPSTIELRLKIAGHGQAVIDPSQMHQITMNLCTNAKHAMQRNGGVLTVAVGDVDIQAQAKILDQDPDLQPGPYVRLVIKDTGHGMAPEVVKRIFEPYFTTKKKDVGTGLGLAMVHGITKNCGGSVLLQSKIGQGTVFYVYLPRVESDPVPRVTTESTGGPSSPTGAGRILFVDDEPELVALGREMLERLGYLVVTRSNGRDALQEFRKKPNDFDLVLTDMTMPKMTGERLARELIRIRPEIPIILCTGFSEQIDEHKAKEIGIKLFLMKPLTLDGLADAVRAVMN